MNRDFDNEGFKEALGRGESSGLTFSSGELDKLYAVLLDIQKNVGAVRKNAQNTHFKSKYATIESVLETIQPELLERDCFIMQAPHGEGTTVTVTTRVVHVPSGQWVQNSYKSHPVGTDPQKMGSAITYARRYALVSLFCLSVEDDDGDSAAGRPEERAEKERKREEGRAKAAATRALNKRVKALEENGSLEPDAWMEATTHPKLIVEFLKLGIPETWFEFRLGHSIEKISEEEVSELKKDWHKLADVRKNNPAHFDEVAQNLIPTEVGA